MISTEKKPSDKVWTRDLISCISSTPFDRILVIYFTLLTLLTFPFHSLTRTTTPPEAMLRPNTSPLGTTTQSSNGECQMSALLDSIMAPNVGVRKPVKRSRRRRPPGWKPMPRAERVYKNCARCGARNHVRRLCCRVCYVSKAEMGVGAGVRNSVSSNLADVPAVTAGPHPAPALPIQTNVDDDLLAGAIGAF